MSLYVVPISVKVCICACIQCEEIESVRKRGQRCVYLGKMKNWGFSADRDCYFECCCCCSCRCCCRYVCMEPKYYGHLFEESLRFNRLSNIKKRHFDDNEIWLTEKRYFFHFFLSLFLHFVHTYCGARQIK